MGNCQEQSFQESGIHFSHFQLKNTYTPYGKNKRNIEKLAAFLDPNQKIDQLHAPMFESLCHYILSDKGKPFRDPNFTKISNHTIPLSSLYDYKHLEKTNIHRKTETKGNFFQQHQLELTYLTTVFYQILKNKEMQDRILITEDINKYQAFLLRLFCNGQQTLVAVDGNIPVLEGTDLPRYVSVGEGNEIWIPLLQKAWCKQIGSFEKAKGLSPEDAFEEITGAPAYSYSLKEMKKSQLQRFLETAIENEFWVTFVGQFLDTHTEGFGSRQVFYMQGQYNKQYFIRSPYLSYSLNGHKENQNKPTIVDSTEILKSFEFMTVGYVVSDSLIKSIKHISKRREDSVYKIKVYAEDLVDIRFVQFYEEYLEKEEKEFYKYSPVLMELYDEQYNLLYEGCPKSITGNRSSHISEFGLIPLNAGTYYFRIEVDWRNQILINQGNIVVYNKHTKLEKIDDCAEYVKLMNENVILKNKPEQITNDMQNSQMKELTIKISEKRFGHVILLKNQSQRNSRIIIDFRKSKNIRIKGEELNKGRLNILIKGESFCFLETVVEDPTQAYELASFAISQS